MKNKIILIILTIITSASFASEYTRKDVKIVSLHPLSKSRIQDKGLAGFTRVNVTGANWGESNCRENSADLAQEDGHLLSILLLGLSTGKRIDILVDDSLPRAHHTVCRITGIFVYN